MTDLSCLASSKSLENLSFGNSFSGTSHIESLEPIGAITSLRELTFNPKKIVDRKATPLIGLRNLKVLDFSNRLFPTETIAWLVARLHVGIESDVLQPFKKLNPGLITEFDTLVVGKGKPFLHSVRDKEKLDKYVKKFAMLVEMFRQDVTLDEPKW